MIFIVDWKLYIILAAVFIRMMVPVLQKVSMEIVLLESEK